MGISAKMLSANMKRPNAIPLLRMGRIAPLDGEHEIWLGGVKTYEDGHTACGIWDMGKRMNIRELVAVVRMEPGLSIEIDKTEDGVYGINIFDEEKNILEFVPFSLDGQGLVYPGEYAHIEIDPINGENEAQGVKIYH